MRYLMCGLALTTAFGAVAGMLMLEEDPATGGLVSLGFHGVWYAEQNSAGLD